MFFNSFFKEPAVNSHQQTASGLCCNKCEANLLVSKDK